MPKKDTIKAKFVVSFKSVFGLKEVARTAGGAAITIAWKRGSKAANKGATSKVNVSNDGVAVFGDSHDFTLDSVTLLQDPKSKKIESKKIEFTIKVEELAKKGKGKTLGKFVVDLGDFGTMGEHAGLTFPVGTASKKKSADEMPTVKMNIKTTWTHINKKMLTAKPAGAPKTAGKKGKTIEISGVEYDLQTDHDAVSESETTVGEHSDSDEDPFGDDDDDEDMKAMKAPAKSVTPAAAPSATTTTAPSSAASEKKEKSKKEKKDKPKDAAAAAEASDEKKYKRKVSTLKRELAAEKEKARKKQMEAVSEKQEVKRLKKELDDVKASGGGGGGGSNTEVERLKKDLERERAEKEVLIRDKAKAETNAPRAGGNSAALAADENARLRADIDRLQKALDREKADKEALQKQQAAPKVGAGAGGAEVSRLQADVERLRKDLERERAEKEVLIRDKAKSSTTTTTTSGSSNEVQKLKEELEQKRRDLDREKIEKEVLIKDLAKVRVAADRSNELRAQLDAQEQQSRDKLAEKDKQINEAKKALDASSAALVGIRAMESELADLRKTKKQFDVLQESRDRENAEAKKDLVAKDGEIQKLKALLDSKTGELDAFKRSMQSSGAEAEQLKSTLKQLETAKSEIAELKRSVDSAKVEVENVKASAKREKESLESANKKNKDLLDASSDTSKRLNAQLASTTKDLELAQKESKEAEARARDLEKKLARMKEQHEENEAALSATSSRDSGTKELEGTLRKIREERDNLADRVRDLERIKENSSSTPSAKSAHDDDADLVEKKQGKINKLKKRLDESKNALEETEEKLAQVKESAGKDKDSDGENASEEELKELQQELDERKIIEKTVYLPDMSFEEDIEDDEDGDEESDEGYMPVAVDKLFGYLIDQNVFDADVDNGPFLKRLSKGLRGSIETSATDAAQQYNWLAYTTSLLHVLVKEDEDFFAEEANDHIRDPMTHGIQLASPKKKMKHPFSSFVTELQSHALIAYENLCEIFRRRVAPLVRPCILRQPPTVLVGESAVKIPRACLHSPEEIIKILNTAFGATRHHRLFPAVRRQLFVQLFYILNALCLNGLLGQAIDDSGDDDEADGEENETKRARRKEREKDREDEKLPLCTTENAFQMRLSLARLNMWVSDHSRHLNSSRTKAQLNGITEAVSVLVIDKGIFKDEQNLNEFPGLSPSQIMQIVNSFVPDKLAREEVPAAAKQTLQKVAARAGKDSLYVDIAVLLPYAQK